MRSRVSFFSFLLISISGIITLSCDVPGIGSTDNKFFVKYYGEDRDQIAVDMLVNDDGTIVILGKTTSGDSSIFIVKADSKGTIIWQKKFGTGTDVPKDLEFTSDKSGYVILSDYLESPDNLDIKITKISNNGDEIKLSKHGSVYNDHSNSITSLENGDYVIAGYSDFDWRPSDNANRQSSILHYRCNSDLVFQTVDWPENFGSGSYNVATKIIQDLDSIYVFGVTNGLSSQNQNGKMVLIYYSLGPSGPKDAVNYIGDLNNDLQSSYIFKTPSELLDGVFVASIVDKETPTPRLRVSKLKTPLHFSPVDDIQFDRTITDGTFNNRNITAVSACPSLSTPEGYLVFSDEVDLTGQTDLLLSKINQEGKEVWSTSIGSSKNEKAASVIELKDGKVLVLFTAQLDIQLKIALMKVNSRGQLSN